MTKAFRTLLPGTNPVNSSIITVVGTPTSSVSSGATSLSLAQPAGTQSGDFGIIVTGPKNNPVTATGWNALSLGGQGFVLTRVYDGTEGSVSVSQNSSGQFAVTLTVFRHVNNSTPIQGKSSVHSVTSGTSVA